MREKSDQDSDDEIDKKIEAEPPEELDKDHGEEVPAPKKEDKVSTGDK